MCLRDLRIQCNARQSDNVNFPWACGCQGQSTGFQSGPCGHHIIHKQDRPSFNSGKPFLIKSNRTFHRFKARLSLSFHRRGCLFPDQSIGAMRYLEPPGQMLGQQSRLIIGPFEQSFPMQRHRHQNRIHLDKIPCLALHPTRHRVRHIRTISVLEAHDQLPRQAVIFQNGPPPVPWPWRQKTGIAMGNLSRVRPHQGHAASIATEPRHKGRIPPTAATEAKVPLHQIATSDATRGIDHFQQGLCLAKFHPRYRP